MTSNSTGPIAVTDNSTGITYHSTKTGAQRQSIGTKINTDLVPYELIVSAAVGLGLGKIKYSSRNFEKGLSYNSLLGSVERHYKAILDGEERDVDTGIPHYMLLASSVAMLCHNIMQGVIIDDRADPKQCNQNIADLSETAQKELTAAIQYWKEKLNGQ